MHEAHNNISAALVPLQQALTLAEPEGYIRLFVDEGDPMAALLQAMVKHAPGDVTDYVNQLRSAFGQAEKTMPVVQKLAEPLSDREFEVLQLLRTELTGPEIASDAPTVRLDLENEPQPDAVLFIESNAGGQSRISRDGYIEGSPELIVEIAASSAAIDTGGKKQAYQRNGVLEYVIWQSYENQLEWFWLTDGEYQLLSPDPDGVIRSRVFPGLWLAINALLSNQMARVLEGVQAGLQSAEHREFMERLRKGK